MPTILLTWLISAGAMVLLAVILGLRARGRILGILIDSRGRYSLAQFQLVVWTILLISLVSGVFWGRLAEGSTDPYSFSVPPELVGVLGISLASTMMAGVVKASKDATYGDCVAASDRVRDLPRLSQIFMQEEGPLADRVVDVTKFQNFVITIVLVVGYAALSTTIVQNAGAAAHVVSVPGFSGAFITLLGISHAGYLAGKLPVASGGNPAPGLTVAILGTDIQPENPRNPPRSLARTARQNARRGRRERDGRPAHPMPPGA
ncbi:MAG TPA: hypothetical protein VGL93_32410 [Streptosporangiaceae bacterium]|jgi:hypothetical protein